MLRSLPGRLGVVAGTVVGTAVLLLSSTRRAHADGALAPPSYPWVWNSMFKGIDMKSARRGYFVYKNVCAQCHSLNLIAFRNLIGTIATEDEAKEWAAEIEVQDGPNDQGEMFDRPGKLADYMPRPYANDNAARAANAGALPPDLSLMEKARVGGPDYLFSLLTGYCEPPAGVSLRAGLYYNPYFPGSAIGMPQPLFDGMVDYEDGTEASMSQLAKDVTTFLTWAAEPDTNERKKIGIQAIFLLSLAVLPTLYYKRLKWGVVKARKLRFTKL